MKHIYFLNFWEERIILLKITATFSGGANYRSKIHGDSSRKANYRLKIARIKTIGVTKMRGNFVEISHIYIYIYITANTVLFGLLGLISAVLMSRMEVKLIKPPQMSHTCGTSKPCQSAQTSELYIYINVEVESTLA